MDTLLLICLLVAGFLIHWNIRSINNIKQFAYGKVKISWPLQKFRDIYGHQKKLTESENAVAKLDVDDWSDEETIQQDIDVMKQELRDMGYTIIRTQYVDNYIGMDFVDNSIPMFDPYIEIICHKGDINGQDPKTLH